MSVKTKVAFSRRLFEIALMHFSIQHFHNKNINDCILLWLFPLEYISSTYLLNTIIYIPSFALKTKHALTKIRIKWRTIYFLRKGRVDKWTKNHGSQQSSDAKYKSFYQSWYSESEILFNILSLFPAQLTLP